MTNKKVTKEFNLDSDVAEAYWEAWRKVYEDKSLTKGDLVLLMVLRDTNNEVNFHKQETLSQKTGFTRRWIRTCLYKLAGLGYITIEKKSIRSLLYVRLKEELKSPIKLIINTTRVYETPESMGSTVPMTSEVQFPSDRKYSSPINGENSKRELQTDSGSEIFSQDVGNTVSEVGGNNAEGEKGGVGSSRLAEYYKSVLPHALQLFPDWKEADIKKALADYTGEATAEDLITALDKLKDEAWKKGIKSVNHFFGENGAKRIEHAIKLRESKIEDAKREAKYEAQRAEEAKLRKDKEELDRIEYLKDREIEDQALELFKVAEANNYDDSAVGFFTGIHPLAQLFKTSLKEGKSYEEIKEAILRINDTYPFGWEQEDYRTETAGVSM